MSSPEQVRLFVGTRVPTPLCAAIREAAGDALQAPPWRVAPEQQWHVTALFIGDRPQASVDHVLRQVERLATTTSPIALEHGQLVTMPKQDPGMLWVRFRPHPGLTALHHALAQALGAVPSIYTPYWPHITLARRHGRRAPTLVNGPEVIPQLVLDEITLFRSDPGKGGRVHRPLATWPLS